MAQIPFELTFDAGMDLDTHPLNIEKIKSIFVKNMTNNGGVNPLSYSGSGGVGAGSNKGKYTPLEGNSELTISGLPSGTNYCIGFLSYEPTNEGYACIYNSNGNNCIVIIRGDTGVVQICFQSTLLPFSLDPQYFFCDGRLAMYTYSQIDPVSGLEVLIKQLVGTNNQNPQFYIGDIEASIATSFWTLNAGTAGTRFYNPTSDFFNPLELIHLGVPTPISQIDITPQPLSSGDYTQNLLLNNGWQFRIKIIDVFGRESLHGIISSQYLTNTGGGCISNSTGQPRCIEITFDTGNAFADQIQIEYRKWTGNDRGGAVQSNWLLCETINKWTTTPATEWYNQTINTNYGTSGSNTFTYIFCANKQSIPLDNNETALVSPGLPLTSSTVAPIGKSNALGNNTYDFQPVSSAAMGLITVQPVLPTNTVCTPQTRTVIVYANIWNCIRDTDSWIRRIGSGHVYGFGNGADQNVINNDLVFGDQENYGFIAYWVGSGNVTTLGEWGNLNVGAASGSVLTGSGNFSAVNVITETAAQFPNFAVIKFTFNNIPAGKGVIRIASHKAIMGDSTIPQTSTYVMGTCPMSQRFVPFGRGSAVKNAKEIEIDCTNGDINYNGVDTAHGGSASNPMFVIMDTSMWNCLVSGYVVEDTGSGQSTPVEMLPVIFTTLSGAGTRTAGYGSFFTDHNGFYFSPGNFVVAVELAWDGCDNNGIQSYLITQNAIGVKYGNGQSSSYPITDWRAKVFLYTTAVGFPKCGRITNIQQIYLCPTTTTGVPGVPVVMTKGAYAITDFSGIATIISHNRYNYASFYSSFLPTYANLVPDYTTTPYSNDYLIISQQGGCTWTTCSGCTPSIADVLIAYQICVTAGCGSTYRVNTATTIYVLVGANNITGVQSGQRYAIACVFEDVIGRCTDAQPILGISSSSLTSGEAGVVITPTLNSTVSSVTTLNFQLYQLQFTIGTGFSAMGFSRMTFVVSRALNFSDYLDWCADLVQYVDNTGATNAVTPTYIRIYYGSLNEFNKNASFQTVCNWQFIKVDVNNNQIQGETVQGDICQIIANGNGTPLPQGIQTPVIYDQSGLFFSIEYNPTLAGLTTGTLFRIIRPNANQSEADEPYYEQNYVIELNSLGVPVSANGTPISSLPFTDVLPYVDSYIVNRLFPVPIPQGLTTAPAAGSSFPPLSTLSISNQVVPQQGLTVTQTTYNQNNLFTNGIVVFSATLGDSSVSYGFFWESNAPSDYWGKGIFNAGRPFFVNPQEAEVRKGNEIAVSDPLSGRPKGLNGIGYFEDINKTSFDTQDWGNIVIMLAENSVVLVICEVNYFTTYFNQSQLVANLLGQISARNPEGSIFQAPEIKKGERYGCRFSDINTIKRRQGKVVWMDAGNGFILCNFQQAYNISKANGYHYWLLNKISNMNILNQDQQTNGITYAHVGIDPKGNIAYLTFFNIPASGSPSYINGQTQPTVSANETIIIDLEGNDFKNSKGEVIKIAPGKAIGFADFTPEFYGMVPRYYLQEQFFTFNSGQPYMHHFNYLVGTPPPFANFYGTQCFPCVTLVCNVGDDKVKRFLYTELNVAQTIITSASTFNAALFEAQNIITNRVQGNNTTPQQSRILAVNWTVRDRYQCAAFLMDLNTPYDPNLIPQTTTNVLWDGNQLQGSYLIMFLSCQPNYEGAYFELSKAVIVVSIVEKNV